MSNQKLASFALLFILSQTLLIGVASAGNHNQVLDCSVDGVHATLLRYAALAEIAYEAPGSHDLHLYRYCPETSISTFDSMLRLNKSLSAIYPKGLSPATLLRFARIPIRNVYVFFEPCVLSCVIACILSSLLVRS